SACPFPDGGEAFLCPNAANPARTRLATKTIPALAIAHMDSRLQVSSRGCRTASFPNSCLGTHVCETLFRGRAETRNGVSRTCVPKQEFGNEDTGVWLRRRRGQDFFVLRFVFRLADAGWHENQIVVHFCFGKRLTELGEELALFQVADEEA